MNQSEVTLIALCNRFKAESISSSITNPLWDSRLYVKFIWNSRTNTNFKGSIRKSYNHLKNLPLIHLLNKLYNIFSPWAARAKAPPPPYTLNLYKIFLNRLELQKSFVTHSNSCCVTPVRGNLPPNSPKFFLHIFHYKIVYSFFIFYPIFYF